MTRETRAIIRDGFGAILDEFRQRRAVDREILARLDVLIRMAGGSEAKIEALREDHDALTEKTASHERRIRAIADSLPSR